MVVLEALTWEARDVENQHIVSIFGRTEDGKSVCVSTEFKPYFYVRAFPGKARELYDKIQAKQCPVDTWSMCTGKDLWGFQNNEERTFMRLNFSTKKNMQLTDSKLRYPLAGDNYPLRVYESNIEPVLRLMHRTGIQSTGWFELPDEHAVPGSFARTDIDLFCNDWNKLKPVSRDDLAPFIIASFDIETNSSTGKFPDADIKEDACFQIAFTLKRQGSTEIYNHTCLCYKRTSAVPGYDIICYETEKDLLMGFRDFVVKHDIDVLTGWNIFGFDLEYIFKRAIINECPPQFYEMSKLYDRPCEITYKMLSSSALGDNKMKLLPMPGRFVFDLYHEVKREHKLEAYSLNFVSQFFLEDQKLDMAPKEMFKRFREEDPDLLSEVAEYCVKDTILPHKLMDKLFTFMNLIEMAKATWVPICYLAERGQQIKVFSQLTRKARELRFMVPTIRFNKNQTAEGYEGATVLDAQSGAYYVPITALDFEGLYPSIMMAHNLCYSSLVMDPKYENIPGVTYETFGQYKFAQNVPSLLPAILAELKEFRKQAKLLMAESTGDMKSIYNGKQLAYKISMNSVYGFTGASKGMLPCVAIAGTVTMKGRSMIEETKKYVEENFEGAKVRYGDTDSVMVEFDMQGRTGTEAIEYSWKLGELAAKACTSLFKKPNNLELEKVYCPYFLYSKKRYAAKLWTKGKKSGKMEMNYIDIKGIQAVRRDNIPFTRETCRDILDVIMESNNPEGAMVLARKRAVELIDGRVPMDKLILSQKLADNYSSDSYPHVRVRNKMQKREPGSEPQSGDRVQFVIVEGGGLQHDKAEDPKWARDHSIALDYEYYFTNKFMKPVSDLLEPLVSKEKVFGDLIPKTKPNKDPKQRSISLFFKKSTLIQG